MPARGEVLPIAGRAAEPEGQRARYSQVHSLLLELQTALGHSRLPRYLQGLCTEVLANHAGQHGWFEGDLIGNLKEMHGAAYRLSEQLKDTSLSPVAQARVQAEARAAVVAARSAFTATRKFDSSMIGRSTVAAIRHNAACPPHSVYHAHRDILADACLTPGQHAAMAQAGIALFCRLQELQARRRRLLQDLLGVLSDSNAGQSSGATAMNHSYAEPGAILQSAQLPACSDHA
ncbi:hypothetical protein WJX73_006274 [Symbiochloris irregularis]|uniref:Uncharacterized protein n=1 Tax=Symbiochloris irregularis TaxID=706552 RepID=A0AAW1PA51_9CHLO